MQKFLYIIMLLAVAACSVPDITVTDCPFKAAPLTLATGTTPVAIAVADIDHDCQMDLVVANQGDRSVGVLLGHGDGTFSPQVAVDLGVSPSSISIGNLRNTAVRNLCNTDTNTDTNDIAFASSTGSAVGVLYNNSTPGHVMLQPMTPMITSGIPESIALVTPNGSSLPDLVTPLANVGGKVKLFLNDGSGGFSNARPAYSTPQQGSPWAITVALLNGDTYPDLIVANRDLRSVTVFYGQAGGTFQDPGKDTPPAVASPKTGATAIVVAKLDGDDLPDIVVADVATATVSVMRNNGDGTLEPLARYPTGGKPSALLAADVDGDGMLDLLVANQDAGSVSVLHGNGDGSFTHEAEATCKTGKSPQAIAIENVNHDGRPDLVVANAGDNTVSVLLARPR